MVVTVALNEVAGAVVVVGATVVEVVEVVVDGADVVVDAAVVGSVVGSGFPAPFEDPPQPVSNQAAVRKPAPSK
jgi:hypothetical protein